MSNYLTDVTIILRECGERTSDAVFDSLQDIVSPEALFRVAEVPFSKSVRVSFEKGISEGREWTLCIDADVFLLPGTIEKLVEEMEAAEPEVFEIQGVVFDKFLGISRPAGNHLYRTSLLDKAISLIPEEGESVRPESDTLNQMAKAGFPWLQSSCLVGLHDFFQFYRDVYQKCYLQAIKHREFLAFPVRFWQEFSEEDPDFLIASRAIADGLAHRGEVLVDRRFREEQALEIIEELGLQEKEPSVSVGDVARALESFLNQFGLELACAREEYQARMNERFFNRSKRGDEKARIRKLERKIERLEKEFNQIQQKAPKTGLSGFFRKTDSGS